VWFKSIFLKTLRDYRVAILGWGIGMGLVIVSPMASVSTLINTPEARATLLSLAKTFAWNADPVAADTVGGYATFKIGIFIFLICVWPLLVASRTLRGEEERSSMDVLLSAPRGRVRVAVEKVAAIWAALLAMGLIIGMLAYLGGRAFKADFGIGDGLLFGLDLALLCAVIAGTALLVSQFSQERGPAAGITAGLLLAFIVLDMVHRVVAGADWVSQLSPIYYYNLTKPLVPSYGTSVGGMLVLLVLALVLNGAAIWLFDRRDVGSTVPLPRWLRLPARPARSGAGLPVTDWSLRSVYARSLAVIVMPTIWWTLGIAGFAAWMVSVVKLLETRMSTLYGSSPVLKDLLSKLGGPMPASTQAS
jgi:ABC-2 type transport system permease protein